MQQKNTLLQVTQFPSWKSERNNTSSCSNQTFPLPIPTTRKPYSSFFFKMCAEESLAICLKIFLCHQRNYLFEIRQNYNTETLPDSSISRSLRCKIPCFYLFLCKQVSSLPNRLATHKSSFFFLVTCYKLLSCFSACR